ncbi:zonular occludens toxin [Acidovorax sp. FJL06]|nr:zonular occludens toxin [Acidovorax sp. FJL06]
MITGLEGIPGSGKSYEAVAFHVLPALRAGRKVITNLPLNIDAFAAIDPAWRELLEVRTRPAPRLGNWNAANIAEQEAFQLWPDREPEPQPENVFTFGTVWDYHSTWRSEQGQGPLYVIDECHVALPKIGTPDHVVQWYKLHRHYNADVLLMTQSFRDISQPIAQLVATLIRCRKADILGKSGSYIRKVHAGYRGALIQQDERKYESQYFGLYRSNTQSVSSSEGKAQDMAPMIVQFNRFKWVWVLFSVAVMVWAFWPDGQHDVWGRRVAPAKPKPATQAIPIAQAQAVPQPMQQQAQQPAMAPAVAASQPQPAPPPPEPKDPLYGKLLHMTGNLHKQGIAWVTFVVSDQGRRVFDLTSDDLKQAGYSVTHLAHCMALVKWDTVVRQVTCDAPFTASGRGDKPVVIDTATGARSDGPTPPRPGQQGPQAAHAEPPRTVPVPATPAARHEPVQSVSEWSKGLAARNAQVRSIQSQ